MSGMLADRSCAGGLAPAGRMAFGGDERREEVEGAALDPRLEPPAPEAFDEADVAALGQEFGFQAHLGAHRAEEVRRVDPPAEAPIERAGARREVERHRDRDGSNELGGYPGLTLAQPLEQHVAAERHADGAETQTGLANDEHA